MKNRAGFTGSTRYSLVLPLVIAAACSSAGGESSGAGTEQQVDGSAAGAPAGQNEAGAASLAAGGASSEPDPIASGNVGSVGDEPAPEPEPEPSRGGSVGAAGEPSGEAGANDEPSEPPGPSEAFLRGEELVKQNACVTCHQADYSGFTVFPNITPDAKTGIGKWSDEQIIDAIRGGRDADGSTLCVTMQRYAFSDEQVTDVVAFLRGIPPVSHRITSACPGHSD